MDKASQTTKSACLGSANVEALKLAAHYFYVDQMKCHCVITAVCCRRVLFAGLFIYLLCVCLLCVCLFLLVVHMPVPCVIVFV